jgi:hypothetical protein
MKYIEALEAEAQRKSLRSNSVSVASQHALIEKEVKIKGPRIMALPI